MLAESCSCPPEWGASGLKAQTGCFKANAMPFLQLKRILNGYKIFWKKDWQCIGD